MMLSGNRNDVAVVYLISLAMFVQGVYNSSSVQPVISTERSVFYRERSAGVSRQHTNSQMEH